MAFATVRDRYSEADIARFYAGGLWRPETFFEVAEQQAQRQPDKVFVTDGTTSLTYRELRDSALALATGLAEVSDYLLAQGLAIQKHILRADIVAKLDPSSS
jgi:cyclohexanecarboxylate-CoA ligase